MPEHIHHFTVYDEFLTLSKSDIKGIASLNINNIIGRNWVISCSGQITAGVFPAKEEVK